MYSRLPFLIFLSLLALLSGCHHKLGGYSIPLYMQPAGFSETYKEHLFAQEQLVLSQRGHCKPCELPREQLQPNLSQYFDGNQTHSAYPPARKTNQAQPSDNSYYSDGSRNGRREMIPNKTAQPSRNQALANRSRLILQKY